MARAKSDDWSAQDAELAAMVPAGRVVAFATVVAVLIAIPGRASRTGSVVFR